MFHGVLLFDEHVNTFEYKANNKSAVAQKREHKGKIKRVLIIVKQVNTPPGHEEFATYEEGEMERRPCKEHSFKRKPSHHGTGKEPSYGQNQHKIRNV